MPGLNQSTKQAEKKKKFPFKWSAYIFILGKEGTNNTTLDIIYNKHLHCDKKETKDSVTNPFA